MLKSKYAKKEDIPEGYAALYTEKDGVFVLTGVTDMKTQADVDAVQEALRKERGLKKDAEAKLSAYEGIESDGLRDQLDELARLRTTKGKIDDTKIEDIVAERLKLDKEKHLREIEKLNSDLEGSQSQVKGLVGEKHKALIEKQLREASAGKVNDSAMSDVLFRASVFEVSEDGNVLTKEAPGVTPGQAPSQWLDATLKTNTHWQKTSTGAGATGNNGGRTTTAPKGEKLTVEQIVENELTFD